MDLKREFPNAHASHRQRGIRNRKLKKNEIQIILKNKRKINFHLNLTYICFIIYGMINLFYVALLLKR